MNDVLQRILAAARRLGLNRGLMAVATFFFVMLIVQGVLRAGAGGLGRAAVESLKADTAAAAAVKRDGIADLKDYAVIGEHGFLGKKGKPEPHKLFGILGDKALFGSDPKGAEWLAVGATVPPGEKIVEINIDNVVLDKDGKRRTVKVFEAATFEAAPSGPPQPPSGPRPAGPAPKAEPSAPAPSDIRQLDPSSGRGAPVRAESREDISKQQVEQMRQRLVESQRRESRE